MAMNSKGQWHPIHENHAIAVMAAAVTFAEPLTSVVYRKFLQAAEEAAFNAGLKSRHVTGNLQFKVGSDGRPIPQRSDQNYGRIFNSTSESDGGASVSEQLQIEPTSNVYRTWNYTSWGTILERLSELLSIPLDLAASATTIATIRLEYLDRFRFDGNISLDDARSALAEKSPWLSPHVYEREGQWHCHTGAFLPVASGKEWLLQVRVDATDEPTLDSPVSVPVRWLNISTAFEKRLTDTDLEPVAALQVFDEFHRPLKGVLEQIISPDLSTRIFLMS